MRGSVDTMAHSHNEAPLVTSTAKTPDAHVNFDNDLDARNSRTTIVQQNQEPNHQNDATRMGIKTTLSHRKWELKDCQGDR